MRILMVGDYPRDAMNIGGGVESVMLYLCEALEKYSELQLEVLTVDRWGLGKRTIVEGGIIVHYVKASTLPGRLKYFEDVASLNRKIRELEPDLVHVHIAGKYSAAMKGLSIPWLLTLHGVRFLEAKLRTGWKDIFYKNRQVRREEIAAVKAARHIISINPFIEEVFRQDISARVYPIENPVSEDYFLMEPQPQPGRVLYVGRITPRKSVHLLIAAFERAFKRDARLRLRLAGGLDSGNGATYGQDLMREVQRKGLGESVSFLGNLDEAQLRDEYQRCSVLVLASELETAPMAITQALASGTPVITTDVGGCRYLLEHGKSGLVVPHGDVEALAQSLVELGSDPEKCKHWGEAARSLAIDRYRADKIAEKTVDIYREMVQGR